MKKLLALLFLAACTSHPCLACRNPVAPEVKSECAKACEHFEKLGCNEAKPTKKGQSCTSVCENMQAENLIVYDLKCAATVKTCSEIGFCPRK